MKHKWLDRRVAAPGPYLTLCTNKDQFNKALKSIGVKSDAPFVSDGANATCHWIDNKSGDLVCIVCLGPTDKRTPVEVAGLLVHEAVHVWQAYADRIGEDKPGMEQEAYAIQAISQELMAEYARQAFS